MDGHAEYWRWLDPYVQKFTSLSQTTSRGDRDLQRIQSSVPDRYFQ